MSVFRNHTQTLTLSDFDSERVKQNVIPIFFFVKKKNSSGEIFNIAMVEFREINYKSQGDYKNQLACETPIV